MLRLKKKTCLEARLEDVGGDRNGPVEDPGHPSGEQNAGDAELVVAAERRQLVFLPGELSVRKRKSSPFSCRCEEVLQPLVRHEVHAARWDIWEKKSKEESNITLKFSDMIFQSPYSQITILKASYL